MGQKPCGMKGATVQVVRAQPSDWLASFEFSIAFDNCDQALERKIRAFDKR